MGNITPRNAAGTDSGAATTQNIHTDPQNVNLLVSEYCRQNITECKPYTPPDVAILFNKILWANWATSALVTFIGIAVMYRKWIKRKKTVEDWPYCVTLYGCIPISKFKWLPESFVTVMLFFKIVPSLVIDVVDILSDNIYYTQLVSSYDSVLNENIHLEFYVFVFLFIFQITGTIKNIILVCLANKKIGEVAARSVTEQSESQLSDTNAYMAITFYQAILAFCLQDGGTALMQYIFVDKYLEDFNWVVATAAIIRVLMSGRTMFIFSKYVYGYVDLAYHSLLVACFLWGLIGVKFIIFLAHALRSIAVTFAIGESSAPQIDCINFNADFEMIQTPMRCLDTMDTTLLILSAISVVGVVFGIVVVYKYGHKVFNQSHSSGRDATTFMAREMRKINDSREKLPIEDHITRSLPRLSALQTCADLTSAALPRRDTITGQRPAHLGLEPTDDS